MQYKRVVEKIPITLRRRLQLLEKMSRESNVVLVDFSPLFKLERIMLMVKNRMVRSIDT